METAVRYLVLGARVVDVLAFWAEDFDRALPRHIACADRQARLPVAEHPGAPPKLT